MKGSRESCATWLAGCRYRQAVSRSWLWGRAVLAVVALTLAGSGCSGSPGAPASGARVKGGTAVFALPPGNAPNYIFPFTSSTYINVINLQFFSYLLYLSLIHI